AVRFQSLSALRLVGTRLCMVLSQTKLGWSDLTAVNDSFDSSFLPFGESPEEGDAVYFGFSDPLGLPGEYARLFLFGEDLSQDYNAWIRLYEEYRRQRRIDGEGCGRLSICASGLRSHYGVTVAWEFFDGTTWQGLDRVRDATRALSLSGFV